MEHQFDRLAKTLADGASRRDVLRRLGGGLATALLASLGLNGAWGQAPACITYCSAFTGRKKQNCLAACEACGGDTKRLCPSKTSDNVACCGPETPDCCNGTCTNLQTDSAHCGSCETFCGFFQACCSGHCCPGELDKCCDGVCRDVQNDPQNCGTCGNVCASGVCCAGVCCLSGQVCCADGRCCDRNACKNGVCTSTRTECRRDADCRLFSNYCDGCSCQALLVSEPDPVCKGTIVNCLVDPCRGYTAVCEKSTGTCMKQPA
jgi:hypothetical protein